MYTLTAVGHELLHDMLADLPAKQAADALGALLLPAVRNTALA